MKISIHSSSKGYNSTIIEANSIDEALYQIQNNRELVKQSIDPTFSHLYDSITHQINIPSSFVISLTKTQKYDIDIEIYDYYRE